MPRQTINDLGYDMPGQVGAACGIGNSLSAYFGGGEGANGGCAKSGKQRLVGLHGEIGDHWWTSSAGFSGRRAPRVIMLPSLIG